MFTFKGFHISIFFLDALSRIKCDYEYGKSAVFIIVVWTIEDIHILKIHIPPEKNVTDWKTVYTG